LGQLARSLDQGVNDRLRVLSGDLDEHEVAGLSLHQRGDLAVVRAEHQVAFSVTWNGAVLDRSRTLADRHGIDDLAAAIGLLRPMPGPAHATRAPQVLEQLLLERTPRLDEETAG
jgi:hypothetical protein